MPTSIKTTQMTWPFPLGKIAPGANFNTASVDLFGNFTITDLDNFPLMAGLIITAHPDNTEKIYICKDANPPDLVNFLNVITILAAGTIFPFSREWGNQFNLKTIYIGAGDAASFATVAITQGS